MDINKNGLENYEGGIKMSKNSFIFSFKISLKINMCCQDLDFLKANLREVLKKEHTFSGVDFSLISATCFSCSNSTRSCWKCCSCNKACPRYI